MQFFASILALAVFSAITTSDACSCQPQHPQQHYCSSDFVVLARVKRIYKSGDTKIYKIRIRQEYKMSEKSVVALKSGRLLTPLHESMCGAELKVGELYAIGGRVISLQARINMCGFMERWRDLSNRQRKGLKRMYHHGCHCEINFCPTRKCGRNKNKCNWNTWSFYKHKDCQRQQGFCLRSAHKSCTWVKNAALTACMKNSTMHAQPLTISRWSG